MNASVLSISFQRAATSEDMENIQKKTPAFKLRGLLRTDMRKLCLEVKHREWLQQPFEFSLSDMAQVDPQIPWDVLLQTNQKCKMNLFKIVYVLCKIDFFPPLILKFGPSVEKTKYSKYIHRVEPLHSTHYILW